MADDCREFSEELVRDAHSLIVNDPAHVELGSKVYAAVNEILRDPRTETVYIVDEQDHLKGIITVSDLLKVSSIQVGAYKRKKFMNIFNYMSLLYSETVEDIMRKPISIRGDQKLINALQLMEEHKLSDLPVVDKNNRLIGELNGLEILTVIKDKIDSGDIDKLF
jgi:CBS domain-containing protein